MISDINGKKSVLIKAKCSVCGFEILYEKEVNEHGFFEIPEAHCPNDFMLLTQIIDGEENNG